MPTRMWEPEFEIFLPILAQETGIPVEKLRQPDGKVVATPWELLGAAMRYAKAVPGGVVPSPSA